MEELCNYLGSTCGGVLFELLLIPLGILIALAYDDIGKPRLELSISETEPKPYGNRGLGQFLYITVTNVPRKAPLARRKTAYECHGTITFLTSDGTPIHKEPMPIRWAGNPEPVKFELDSEGKRKMLPDLLLMRLSRFMNIPPDDKKQIDVAMRLVRDNHAYGWTDESYLHSWKHPDFEIPPGDFLVRVSLRSEDNIFQPKVFHLKNPEDFQQFGLDS